MKILLTTIFDIPHEGGLSTHVTTLKHGLEELGHQVDILSFTEMNFFLKKAYAQAPGFLLNKLKKGKGQLLNDENRMKLLYFYLKRLAEDYDVINSQDVYATMSAVKTGIPTVVTVHGYFSFEAISRGAILEDSQEDHFIQRKEIEAYKSANKIIAVDQRIKEYVESKAQVDAFVIKNFINTNEFHPAKVNKDKVRQAYNLPQDANVLFVPRRMTKKNGVIFPTLALPAVLERHPHTFLVYAGTGEEMAHIKVKVAEYGLGDHVRLLGSIPHNQMVALYGSADIVLIPSVHSYGVEEATSISALEAMGSGSPVIASAVGGLKEIFVHEHDGLLVNEKDINGLSEAVVCLLDNPQYAHLLAKNARKKIEMEYSHLAAANKYLDIYKSNWMMEG